MMTHEIKLRLGETFAKRPWKRNESLVLNLAFFSAMEAW